MQKENLHDAPDLFDKRDSAAKTCFQLSRCTLLSLVFPKCMFKYCENTSNMAQCEKILCEQLSVMRSSRVLALESNSVPVLYEYMQNKIIYMDHFDLSPKTVKKSQSDSYSARNGMTGRLFSAVKTSFKLKPRYRVSDKKGKIGQFHTS